MGVDVVVAVPVAVTVAVSVSVCVGVGAAVDADVVVGVDVVGAIAAWEGVTGWVDNVCRDFGAVVEVCTRVAVTPFFCEDTLGAMPGPGPAGGGDDDC